MNDYILVLTLHYFNTLDANREIIRPFLYDFVTFKTKLLSTNTLVITNSTETMANTFITRPTETDNATNIKQHIINNYIQNNPSKRKIIIISGEQEDDGNPVKID